MVINESEQDTTSMYTDITIEKWKFLAKMYLLLYKAPVYSFKTSSGQSVKNVYSVQEQSYNFNDGG
jgi:hypothetical protein